MPTSEKRTKILKMALCLLMALTAVFLLANFALAAAADLGINYAEGTGLASGDPRIIATKIIRVALGFLGIIAVGLIIYAGFVWMMSGGNEERIERAKNILKNAVIGLIIVLSAFAIASFVLNKLIEASGGGSGGRSSDGRSDGGFGARSGQPVDYTFPADNQRNVPRNLKRISAFLNEPAAAGSFTDPSPNTEFRTTVADVQVFTVEPTLIPKGINKNRVAIFPAASLLGRWLKNFNVSKVQAASSDPPPVEFSTEVTTDGKTLVFNLKPEERLLGSPNQIVWYTVTLKKGIKKSDGVTNLFSALSGQGGDVGYRWRFAVGTEIDNTPPKIQSVIPRPGSTEPKNVVVQINFSEAIDPTSASGKLEIEPSQCTDEFCYTGRALKIGGFNNIAVRQGGDGDYIAGNLYISNQYRTVEFLTIDECGRNSCGNAVYCLPGEEQIEVYIKAATLALEANEPGSAQAKFQNGYDGVVDMAGNSLDGNGNGAAQGPVSACDLAGLGRQTPICSDTGDNAFWTFNTSSAIDITPPEITSVTPTPGEPRASLTTAPQAVFNKHLMSYSLNTTSVELKDNPVYYWIYSANSPPTASQKTTTVYVGHNQFERQTAYSIQFNSGVKDIYQNCYYPCSGLTVEGGPSCCNGAPSSGTSCW